MVKYQVQIISGGSPHDYFQGKVVDLINNATYDAALQAIEIFCRENSIIYELGWVDSSGSQQIWYANSEPGQVSLGMITPANEGILRGHRTNG